MAAVRMPCPEHSSYATVSLLKAAPSILFKLFSILQNQAGPESPNPHKSVSTIQLSGMRFSFTALLSGFALLAATSLAAPLVRSFSAAMRANEILICTRSPFKVVILQRWWLERQARMIWRPEHTSTISSATTSAFSTMPLTWKLVSQWLTLLISGLVLSSSLASQFLYSSLNSSYCE